MLHLMHHFLDSQCTCTCGTCNTGVTIHWLIEILPYGNQGQRSFKSSEIETPYVEVDC